MAKKRMKNNRVVYSGMGDGDNFFRPAGAEHFGASILAESKSMSRIAGRIARDTSSIDDAMIKLKKPIANSRDKEHKDLFRELEEEEQLLHWRLVKIEAMLQSTIAESQLMLLDLAELKDALREATLGTK